MSYEEKRKLISKESNNFFSDSATELVFITFILHKSKYRKLPYIRRTIDKRKLKI